VFNGDNFDETEKGYGANPPTQAVVFLNQPMNHFTYLTSGLLDTFSTATRYYHLLQEKKPDGSPQKLSDGRTPRQGSHGDPYLPGVYSDTFPADKRMLMSSGPFTLAPGASLELHTAFVY